MFTKSTMKKKERRIDEDGLGIKNSLRLGWKKKIKLDEEKIKEGRKKRSTSNIWNK